MLFYSTKYLSTPIKKSLFFSLLFFVISNPLYAGIKTEDIGNSFFKINHKTDNKNKPEKANTKENKSEDEIDIGNSFFKNQANNLKGTNLKPINQFGPAYEARENLSDVYLFVNQLLTNQIFYELRFYGAYNYISKNSPNDLPNSSQSHPLGYGGAGVLGYNFAMSTNISILPFIRFQVLKNMLEAYKDSFGNKIESMNYALLLGGKISARVTDNFAFYAQYYAGYQYGRLSGAGYYVSAGTPILNIIQSTIELGAPFKITKTVNLTPYIQYLTLAPNPNQVARSQPYSLGQLVNVTSIYGLKLGIVF